MPIRLENIDLADGAGTGLGILLQYAWYEPKLAAVNTYKTATNLSAAASPTASTAIQTVSTWTAQPDYARTLLLSWTDTTSPGTTRIEVFGTRLHDGAAISEIFTKSATDTAIAGVKAFHTLSAIQFTLQSGAWGGGGDEVFSVGTIGTAGNAKMGLPYKLAATTDLIFCKKAIVSGTDAGFTADAATISVANQTIAFAAACTDASATAPSFFAAFRSNYGLPAGRVR